MATIRELRDRVQWSQTELAMKLGISPRSVTRYEAGMAPISYPRRQLIANLFGVSVDEIEEVAPRRERVTA